MTKKNWKRRRKARAKRRAEHDERKRLKRLEVSK